MNDHLEKHGKRLLKQTLRMIALPLGGVFFAIGLVVLPLPLPFGAILMAVGLFIAAFNPRVLRWLRHIRGKFPQTSARIRHATPHLPAFLRRIVTRTEKPGLHKKMDVSAEAAGEPCPKAPGDSGRAQPHSRPRP